jgi:signal transduction histidine kinase
LQELANRVSRTNVNCVLEAPALTKVYDNAAAIHLYRIAQEAVNNGIKHGDAKNIVISLNTQNNQVELTVRDDGCGIQKHSPRHGGQPGGMGLRVMNYRAAMIGATVTIEPGPGCGTLVRCVMPNRPPAARRKPSSPNSAPSVRNSKNGGRERKPEPRARSEARSRQAAQAGT